MDDAAEDLARLTFFVALAALKRMRKLCFFNAGLKSMFKY